MKGLKLFMIVMLVALFIALLWDKLPIISQSVHYVLNPTFGALLNWNHLLGLIIITLILTLVISLIQKFTTDQEALKSLKEEQKSLRDEMKNHKENPEKMMELQKKQMELIPRSFELSSKSLIYTSIPFILLFRWFTDYFSNLENLTIFLFAWWGWIGPYIVFSMIFSLIIRKILKIH